MTLGMILLASALALGGGTLLSLWAAGRFARRRRGRVSTALPPAKDVPLDALASHDSNHLALIDEGAQALSVRLDTLALAKRSVDLLYYLWDDDLSGRLIAREVLAAADRGVRVRILIDDVNMPGRDPSFKAMDQHPRIEVRLFNPVRNRDWGLLRGLELVFSLMPYNRRMHGKLWIADGRVAVIGGRNLGDEYFGLATAPRRNFDDLDCVLTGPIVADAAALFDRFWNAPVAVPIRRLLPDKTRALRRLRRRLARRLGASQPQLAGIAALAQPGQSLRVRLAGMIPAPSLALLADPPEKALGTGRQGWLPDRLLPLVQQARSTIAIMTPYFVPGSQGLGLILDQCHRGIRVRLVTNGLAAADNLFVFGAYAWYRPRLLLAGVRVFETAPQDSTGTMLHANAAIVADAHGFVGSFNFDQRSVFLNTEIGVVFSDPPAVAALAACFDAATVSARGYALTHDGTRPAWRRGTDDPVHKDPKAARWRRATGKLLGLLPIHRFL